MDSYYIASGMEYTAYENWQQAIVLVEGAQMVLNEVEEVEEDLQEEWDNAKYELDRSNNRQEYESRIEIFDDVNARLNSLLDKKNTAQTAIDENDLEAFEEEFNNATQARLEIKQFVYEETGTEFDEYDPTQGPPSYPEDPNAIPEEFHGLYDQFVQSFDGDNEYTSEGGVALALQIIQA